MQQQVLQLWTGQCCQGCLAATVQLQDLELVSMLLQPILQASEVLKPVPEDDAACCCCCFLSPGLADQRAGEAVTEQHALKQYGDEVRRHT